MSRSLKELLLGGFGGSGVAWEEGTGRNKFRWVFCGWRGWFGAQTRTQREGGCAAGGRG